MSRICRLIVEYLDKESVLLSDEHPIHDISSDIIESDFGIFKDSMPSNRTSGFSGSILYIPLRPKGRILADATKIDVKNIMREELAKK